MARTRRKKPGTGVGTPVIDTPAKTGQTSEYGMAGLTEPALNDPFAGYEEGDDEGEGGREVTDAVETKDGPLTDEIDGPTKKKKRATKSMSPDVAKTSLSSPSKKPKKDMVDRAVNADKRAKTNKKEHKVESSAKATNMEVVSMSIPPGQKIGYQNHQSSDQLIRVERGKAKVVTSEGTHQLKKGSVVIVPAGMEHSITNMSKKGDLKIFGIYSPPLSQLSSTFFPTMKDRLIDPTGRMDSIGIMDSMGQVDPTRAARPGGMSAPIKPTSGELF